MIGKSETKGILEKLLGQFGKYDFLCRFFPGMALYALLARFTKFGNLVNSSARSVIIDILIGCIAGVCVDALGSVFGKFYVIKKGRVGYEDYLKARDKGKSEDTEIKPHLNMLEHRRVMYRNISVALFLFLGAKIYELSEIRVYCGTNDVFMLIITLIAAFICGYNSRRIDYYKQKRIEICKGADESNTEK